MNAQEILSQPWTKTRKIQQLILLGLTRREIAILVTNNNYGFVQNVYAKMKAQGLLNATIEAAFNRRFGVEIEAYNVTRQDLLFALHAVGIEAHEEGYNHTTRAHWKIVSDGSLTGTNTFELVSPILEGEQGLAQLEKVCQALEQVNAKVNKSCGLHIHFDAAGFNLATFKRIYKGYARLEGFIDSFMPRSRRANNNYYCKSIAICNIEQRINTATTIEAIARIFDNNRYHKINPTSYSRHKTIEFRQHSGTVEFKKISSWVKFLNALLTTATREEVTRENLETECGNEIMSYINNRIETLR